MAHQVNLDALIPREDFEVLDGNGPSSPTATLQIRNLEPGDFFYSVVRKPDFQRETSDWSPPKICGFIQSFLDGDLIPALILWQAGNHTFVIDGAHRLSALIAWVHDDYGDGTTSKKFFDGVIPEDQLSAADYTKKLIKKQIGSYADHQFAVQFPEKSKPEVVERAKRLGRLAVQLQWVQGDASKAEASFFKINQQATPIDATELRLLKSRKLPNALAARAIVRAGTGHKYWSNFDEKRRNDIEALSKDVNELLFAPSLKTPIKTLDLPVAGKGYSSQTLPLVYEFVNLTNDIKADTNLLDDGDGEATTNMLRACKKIVDRISGTHPSSLGLHPAIYFYSSTGRYQQTAFLAVVAMICELDKKNLFRDFTKTRRNFEEFLLAHKILVNQVTVKYGSGAKGYARLKQLFLFILTKLIDGQTETGIIDALADNAEFSFLQPAEKDSSLMGKDFSADAKSAVFLRDALRDPLRCGICGGLVHRNAISIDHVVRRADGGLGAPDNGQLTHPYCNTTIKN
jgi:Protein of unknown function DUF262/HNH endonuclease